MTAATYIKNPTARPPSISVAGLVAVVSGLLGFGLLAVHPAGDARNFAELLQQEASNQAMDALVHGGFIFILAAQLACYSIFTRAAAATHGAALAGLALFAFGSVFLGLSLLVDGLLTPAIAAQYAVAAAAEKIDYAKSLFVLTGNMVRFLMPVGLALQATALIAWGWALFAGRLSRPAGLFGLGAGSLIVAALVVGVATMNALALMGAIVGMATWAMVVGAVMIRGGI